MQIESKNLFLSALSAEELKKISPHLETVKLEYRQVLHRSGERYDYVYFPEDSIVSIVNTFEDGSSIEAGMIGKEGIVGISVILSDGVSPRQTTVQQSGAALRIKTEAFKATFNESSELRALALKYVYAFYSQVSQNTACNRYHSLDGRLAKWLLMCHDRSETGELMLTQDFMAQMLGVHRPGVTLAAMALQEKELINYVRGNIKITDKAGLEALTCDCYRIIRASEQQYLRM
ncbi:MAG: Crp/Fnr family transcriptional regulator [Acidobacteriota bacterium]|nr:Crp/Fnr family transcriptional regulator [Acidobacteriota bacterium]